MKFILILIISSIVQLSKQKDIQQLAFLASIFRHGARGPIYENLNYDSEFNEFYKEELTPTGQRQHYVLGQTIRERYIESGDFDLGLSPKYNNTEIYVRSTNVNRTINSAYSQLQGLYPPGTGPSINDNVEGYLWMPPYKDAAPPSIGKQALQYQFQNIPAHMRPKDDDPLLNPTRPSICPGADKLQEKYNTDPENIKKYNQVQDKYKDILQQFTTVLGKYLKDDEKPLTFNTIEPIWDTLIADKFNGQHFEGYDDITEEMWEGIKQMDSLWWFLHESGSPDFVKIGTSQVLQSWIEYSEMKLGNVKDNKTKDLSDLKYIMYSCHDDNIVNMMAALQLSSFECLWKKYNGESTDEYLNCNDRAYYAASILYELHTPENEDPYVMILFDGEYQNMLCTDTKSTKCDYETFKTKIYDYIYVDGDSTKDLQIKELCQYNGDDSKIKQVQQEKFLIQIEGENHLVHRDVYFYVHIYLGIILTFAGIYYIHLKNKNKKYIQDQQEFNKIQQQDIEVNKI